MVTLFTLAASASDSQANFPFPYRKSTIFMEQAATVFLCRAEKPVLCLRRKKTSHEMVKSRSVWRLREVKIRVRSSESDFRERWEEGGGMGEG